AILRDPDIVTLRRNEHPVRVLEASGLDPVHPYHEGLAECLASRRGRADKVRYGVAAGLDHAVAEPSHPAGLLYTVIRAEAQAAIDVRPDFVRIEMNGAQRRCESLGESCLAGTRKAHDQNLARHWQPHFMTNRTMR